LEVEEYSSLRDRLNTFSKEEENKEKELFFAQTEANVEKLRQEAKKAGYESAVAEIVYKASKREEDKIISSDRYNHVYRFVYPICEEAVTDCMQTLSRWSRLSPGCDMEIVFLFSGREYYGRIRSL